MVNVGYRAARMQGSIVRSAYRTALPWIVKRPLPQSQKVGMNVYSFSGDRDLPEQVASIRSFIRHVGIPNEFIVISDGTHSLTSRQLLCQIHPCIKVVSIESLLKRNLPQCVHDYASWHPLGKKLSILISIPVTQATLYADSDILFFPGAKQLITLTQLSNRQPQCLLDSVFALDERVLNSYLEKSNSVNSGFMILREPLNWDVPLERFAQLKDTPNYFTEQTMVHLAMRYNQAKYLCPDQFIVRLDDQFLYPDKYAGSKIVLRHYVKPVRHKLWFHVTKS